MRGLWFILFIVAVQIIAGIVQKRKKEAERKAREEAMLRQRQPHGSVSQSESNESGSVTPADLEMRRKAQLEQLRQRRAGRRVGVPVAVPAPRTGIPVPAQRSSRQTKIVAPTIGTSDQARTNAQQAEKRAKELERQERGQQSRRSAQQQENEDAAAHRAYEAGFHRVADEAGELHAVGSARGGAMATAITAATASTLGASRMQTDRTGLVLGLADSKSLREAIILREILDRPVSLREEPV